MAQVTRIAQQVGPDLNQTIVSLDEVYDSRANRKAIFNRGMIPNIPANPRGRKTPTWGRKVILDVAIFQKRFRTVTEAPEAYEQGSLEKINSVAYCYASSASASCTTP